MTDNESFERAMRSLDLAIRVLQVTAVLTLGAVAYAVWRWHRGGWK